MNSALNYFSSRLAGFSSNIYSVQTQGKSSGLTANDQILLNLPSAAILDCRSLRIAFNASVTSTAAGRLPGNLEKIFARTEVLVGGQSVSSTNNSHGLLVSMKERVEGYDCGLSAHPHIVREVGDYSSATIGATAPEAAVGSDDASGAAVATTTAQAYVLELSNTFLSSCEPRYLDASLLNQIQVRLTLAPNSVLSVSTGNVLPSKGMYAASASPAEFDTPVTGLSASYELNNFSATITCISFASSEYDTLLSTQLATQGFLSCPFKNYLSFRQTHTGSSKFQLSTRSLDRVYFGFLYTGATEAGSASQPVLKNSQVINSPSLRPGYLVADSRQASRVPGALESYVGAWETFALPSKEFTAQVSINNSFLPQAPAPPAVLGALTEIASGYKLPHDTTQLARLTTDFVNCFSFSMSGSDSYRVASGIDCRGANVSCQLLTNGNFDIGSSPSFDSFIVCEMSSEMRISVGRSVSIVT
jgi:hypothetical protein